MQTQEIDRYDDSMIEINKSDSTGGYEITLLGDKVHTRRITLDLENHGYQGEDLTKLDDVCLVHRELEEAIEALINNFVHRQYDIHKISLVNVKPEDRIKHIDIELYGSDVD